METSEEVDLRAMIAALEEIADWVKTVTEDPPSRMWEALPRSPLFTDDQRTHPYRVSHRAWMSISAAVDFLHCLQRSLVHEDEDTLSVRLYSYAQMALVRGALENACCAVWLLGPARQERITNRLALEWDELGPSYRLRQLTGATPPRTIEARKVQLASLLISATAAHGSTATGSSGPLTEADARRQLKQRSYVDMVQRAGDLTPGVDRTTTEAVWRMCSGLAHGDTSATIGLLDRQVVGVSEPGVRLVRVSAATALLHEACRVALTVTRHALHLMDTRRKPQY